MQTGLGSGVVGHVGTNGQNGTPAAPGQQAGQGAAPAAPARVLSDDEILGLDFSVKPRGSLADGVEAGNGNAEGQPAQQSATAELQEMLTEISEPAELQEVFNARPELRQAWRAEKAYREVFPTVETAREVGKLFPTVEDARAASAQVADLAQLDRWFFSGQPESHAEMAAAIYRMNPAAFRSLARAMGDVLGLNGGRLTERDAAIREMVGEHSTELRAPQRAQQAAPLQTETSTTSATTLAQNDRAGDSSAGDAGAPGQFASFYQETNAVVVEGVVDAIQSQVQRLLPEGVAAGAQKRVIGEIYRELDASLRGNRALAQQVRQAFRSGAMDQDHQAAIVGMVLARAKQALPGVAKKVIGEWTSGVLAANQEKISRQRSAAGRVDITGSGGLGAGIRRALTPNDVDYGKLSDGDILNL
jgi:hypothetical protein